MQKSPILLNAPRMTVQSCNRMVTVIAHESFFFGIKLNCYCDRASGGLKRLEILELFFERKSGMGCNMALYQVPEGIS